MTIRQRSLLALVLLAPVPTLGIAAALIFWPGAVGRTVFTAAKIWLLVLPVVWHLSVDKARLSWSPPRNGGLGVGLLIGLCTAAVIVAACWLIAIPLVDPAALRVEVSEMGLASPLAYILGALYWIFVNSVIEEYVFRWFIQSRCETLWSRPVAIAASATIFTIHHVVAMATYFSPGLVTLASAGVFNDSAPLVG